MSDARKTAYCSFPSITQISAIISIAVYKGYIQAPHRALGHMKSTKTNFMCKFFFKKSLLLNTLRCTQY